MTFVVTNYHQMTLLLVAVRGIARLVTPGGQEGKVSSVFVHSPIFYLFFLSFCPFSYILSLFPQFLSILLYSISFSSIFLHSLPQFGPPGGRLANLGRPWLRGGALKWQEGVSGSFMDSQKHPNHIFFRYEKRPP